MPSFRYSTRAQLIDALRARYAAAEDGVALRIAKWFDSNLSIDERRALLGTAAGNRIAGKAAQYDALQAERGE